MDIKNVHFQDDIRKKIREACVDSDDPEKLNVAAFAKYHGFTPNYIHQILKGGPISDRASRAVGFIKSQPVYIPLDEYLAELEKDWDTPLGKIETERDDIATMEGQNN